MIPEINGETKLTGLLGSPVAHSISPSMHNEGFKILGLNYVYLAFDVSPENLKVAIDGLKTLNVKGFNLTMPHKTQMFELADELTPAAQLTGAVNTVIHENGKFIGHTTDGIGYMDSLKDAGHDIIGKQITLLGAGGAANAIIAQAALDGVKEIHVFKRKNSTWHSTQEFIDLINSKTSCNVKLFDFHDETQLENSISSSTLLVNATSIGMEPNINESPIKNTSILFPELIVSDIIYHPKQTKLLKDASVLGCSTLNGLYMLLYQGAAAFKCWTKQDMPVHIIKKKYFQD